MGTRRLVYTTKCDLRTIVFGARNGVKWYRCEGTGLDLPAEAAHQSKWDENLNKTEQWKSKCIEVMGCGAEKR